MPKFKNTGKISRKYYYFSVVTALFIVLLIGISFYQQVQFQAVKRENKELREQIERVEETDISQSKIDTFGRYFLTYYFSAEENQEKYRDSLKPYVSADTTDWKTPGKTLKSVNYFGSERTKVGYEVSFVLILTDGEYSKTQKITFEVEPSENSFLVTNQPMLSDFSFN